MVERRWFRSSLPPVDLAAVIRCRWNATAEGGHDLIPDGCVELLWIADRGIWVCGPDTTAWSFSLRPGTKTTGIRFHPGAAPRVLGVSAAAIVDQRVYADAIMPAAAVRRLDDVLSEAADGAGRTTALEQFVRSRLDDARSQPMAFAASLLSHADRPFGRLDRVAEQCAVSPRQFRRRFRADVGLSPAFYVRIVRLQRFCELAAAGAGRNLAELAATAGYTDQAHLGRDCRDLAAMTAGQLVGTLHRTSFAA